MKDGIILFYVKDNEVLPVAMSNEQHQMLQMVLTMVFGDDPVQIIKNKSQGTVENLMDTGAIKKDSTE
ncbi:hypothetical protein KAR91_02400 [Candidatus Pacearchaeota archaeon]|nr:hypothetical protein [Candidatus Pacearchaeota archaeon]